MKFKNLIVLFLVLHFGCNKEDNEVEELANQSVTKEVTKKVIPLTIAIANLENKSGVVISGNTVTFTKDITIPRDVTLNFIATDRMIINNGVTVTIDGTISAGKFQIFEIASGGKVTGCPQIDYIIPQWWGVDDTGTNPTSDLFQVAVESFPCIKKFVARGEFLIDREILLNVNGRDYDFSESHFTGTKVGTLLMYDNIHTTNIDERTIGAGGLITIGSRKFDINETYSVTDVTLKGGIYQPKFNHDNSLGILNAKNIKISNVNIIGSEGLRGIALQTPRPTEVTNPIIEDISIEAVTQEGGVNVINIDIFNGIAKDITIADVKGNSIDEINPQTHIDKEAAIRLSSQGDALRIQNVKISKVRLKDVYWGVNLQGVNANVSDVVIYDVDFRGINIRYPDIINLEDITIKGKLSSTQGIVTIGGTSLSEKISLKDIRLEGKFNHGIFNENENTKFENITIKGEFNFGIYNNGPGIKSEFHSITIQGDFLYGLHNKGADIMINGMEIAGNFDYGIFNENENTKFEDITIQGDFLYGLHNKGAYIMINGVELKGNFDYGIYNTDSGIVSKFNGINISGDFIFGVHNSARNSEFKGIMINNTDDTYIHAGVYNHYTGTNSIFKGVINGNFDHGLINAAMHCTSDFSMNGSFKNGAIFTFYNKNGYSSFYKIETGFTDQISKAINHRRTGDIYDISEGL